VLRSTDTCDRRVLLEGGADARYVDTGHLVYINAGTLMVVPFDLAGQKVNGNPAMKRAPAISPYRSRALCCTWRAA
jgi:hypothetical protein